MYNVDREGVVTSAELFHEWNGMNGGMQYWTEPEEVDRLGSGCGHGCDQITE